MKSRINYLDTVISGHNLFLHLLVSLVFDFPVNNWRKSWYSLVSESCIFDVEYMFIVLKKETSSSNNPNDLPSAFARMSPNLSQVQWGMNTDFTSWPAAKAFSCTASMTSFRNWWKVLLHRPGKNEVHYVLQIVISTYGWSQYIC